MSRGILAIAMLASIPFALPAAAAEGAHEVHPEIDRALDHLYNFAFDDAHAILDAHIDEHPEDPLGYVFRAGALLFYELDRLKILESEFFKDDAKIAAARGLDPDLEIKRRLMAALDEVREIAEARLAGDPDDADALFALCLRHGMITDYVGLVEKRKLKSLSSSREAERWARRLLALDPSYYDAHLSGGVNEYLLASLPFFVRWFIRIEGIEGSKEKAFERLRLVAEHGSYLGPFARILMSIMSLREKRPGHARDLLADLSVDYPGNPLIRKELQKVSDKMARGELTTAK